MKLRLIILYLIILPASFFAQDQQTNLEKYWRYRDRLRNNFVVVDPNVEMPGVNIPIAEVWLSCPKDANDPPGEYRFIGTGDFNVEFNHYISILATEYRLLSNNGQDVTTTVTELLYAMLAFERIDAYAEMQYRKALNMQDKYLNGDINGFFLRGDQSTKFFYQYKEHFFDYEPHYFENLGTQPDDEVTTDMVLRNYVQGRYNFNSGFEAGGENNLEAGICRVTLDDGECKITPKDKKLGGEYKMAYTQGYEATSNDNMVHMILALSLVKSLVDNNVDISGIPITWIGGSPIKSDLETKGILFNGHVNFKNWADNIVNRMVNFLSSNAQISIPPKFGDIINPVTLVKVAKGSDEDGAITALWYGFVKAANNRFNGNISLPPSESATLFNGIVTGLDYKDLEYLAQILAVVGNTTILPDLEIAVRGSKHLDLPLLHMILEGHTNANYVSLHEKVLALLNKAPICGNRNYNPLTLDQTTENPLFYSLDWQSSQNSIINQPDLKSNVTYAKETAGLDYMFLHNLYYLAFNIPSPASNFEISSTITSPAAIDVTAQSVSLKTGFHAYADESSTVGCEDFAIGLRNQYSIGDYETSSKYISCNSNISENRLHIYPLGLQCDPRLYKKINVTQCPDNYFNIQQNHTNDINTSIRVNSIDAFLSYQFDGYGLLRSIAITDTSEISQSEITKSTVVNADNANVIVYPNPVISSATIECSDATDMRIEITNTLGFMMEQKVINSNHVTLDLSSYTAGIYFIRIDHGSNTTVKKRMKQK